MKVIDAINAVVDEYNWAAKNYGPMRSHHEGYATILEELEELWDEIKKKPHKREIGILKKEAVQVAAMALRFLIDCVDE